MALEAIIGSLTGKIVDLAVDSVGGSLGVALDLKEKLKELKRHLLYIQSTLGYAEERQMENEAVRAWLDALKEVAYEADNLLDDVEYDNLLRKNARGFGKVRNFFSSGKLVFRPKIGSKTNDILRRIEKIASEGRLFKFKVDSQPETSVGRETERPMTKESYSFVKESDVVGRETEKDQIVDMLTSNLVNNTSVSVLAIVGMGGLGKTTLAQLVYNDPRVVDHFSQLRAWICISDVWDMKKIIEGIIAEVTGEKRKMETLDGKQRGLREALTGKRYLIVLDDVWNEDPRDWNNLKNIMDCGDKGSAILVTSRSKRVSEIMITVPSYDLSYLSEDDSWILFSSRAFAPGAERPEELVEIGKDIANKCGQLPLALDMVGSLLYMKSDKRDWLMIKESSNLWNLQTEIFPALWLSYKHLPPHSKRCFTFCTVFPKDHVMDKDRLIQMWVAHGFVPSSDGIRLEDKGREIFYQLVQRSFLHHIAEERKHYGVRWNDFRYVPTRWKHELVHNISPYEDGERLVTTCRMHDLVHDLGQSIVRNECMALTAEESPEVAAPKDVHDLSISTSYKKKWKTSSKILLSLLTEFPKLAPPEDVYHLSISSVKYKKWKTSSKILRSLLADDVHETEIPPHTSLRVLQLRNCTKPPSSLDRLRHLRYLDLSESMYIKKLPESICTLFHLQTLDLSRCRRLHKLPTRMGSMISLRHLYLEGCYRLNEMPRGMGRLTNLQTLTKYVVGDEAQGKGIGELKALPLCSPKIELYNTRHVKDDRQAKEANLHSKNIRHLELYYCSGKKDNLHSIKMLAKNEGYGSDKVLDALKPPVSIEVLRIFNYAGLKSFNPVWMVELQGLVELELKDCRGCDRLPPLWRFKSLEVLCLAKMPSLKYIMFNDGDALPAFPSLKQLTLDELRSLEGWWEKRNLATDMTTIDYFPALVSLEMWCCPELSDPMPLLPRLKYLNLRANRKMPLGSINRLTWSSLVSFSNCGENVENLYQKKRNDNEDSDETNKIHEDSNEISKTYNEELNEMSGNVEDFSQTSMSMISPVRLREMWLHNCEWIFSSPAVGLGLWRSMTALETLHIWSCKSLVDLPELLQGLTSLRSLFIHECENVTWTSSTISNPCLPPLLEELEFYECERLTTMLSCPASLKSLRILKCPNIITLAAANKDLTSLPELAIQSCENLTSLHEGLTALRELEIWSCENLTSLPEGLIALQKLEIDSCENLTSLPEGLTALQILEINRCKNLASLPESLTALEELKIWYCENLTSLPQVLQQRLTALQQLVIVGCPELGKKCAKGSGEYWHLISNIPHRYIGGIQRTGLKQLISSFNLKLR